VTAPVLERHRRAAAQALKLSPQGNSIGEWVRGDEGALERRFGVQRCEELRNVAQLAADAEFDRTCRALRACFDPATNPNAHFTAACAIAERIAGARVEDGDWEDVSALAMRGWK